LLFDYTFIRGFCYLGGWRSDKATIEKELGYAVRLNLNSARIWLNIRQYQRDPKTYVDQLVMFVRTAHNIGISTMPIFFNGNGLDPNTLKPDFRKEGDVYIAAIINALKDEPGLLMWDIMNEPECNDYWQKAPENEKDKRFTEIYDFVRYYITKTKELDTSKNPVTVGVTFAECLKEIAHVCDVLTFHDYRETHSIVQISYDTECG
jgi:beta-galactosidase/beta-glucuronidase